MEQFKFNPSDPPLLLRMSQQLNVENPETPPKLLLRMTTPPLILGKREREPSSESNEKWKYSGRGNAPDSKRQRALPTSFTNGLERQIRKKGKPSTHTWRRSTPLLLSRMKKVPTPEEPPSLLARLTLPENDHLRELGTMSRISWTGYPEDPMETTTNLSLDSSQHEKRAREEDMPWFNPSLNSSRRASCVETCRTIFRFSEDLSGVKALLRVASDLPEGIPSSQWD